MIPTATGRRTNPRPPGHLPRRRVATLEDAKPTHARSTAEVRAAVLAQLQAGPLERWRLAQQLREPDTRVQDALNALCGARKVTRLGTNPKTYRYALYGYTETAPVRTPTRVVAASSDAKAGKGSWWLDAPRDGFTERASKQADRMGHSKEAMKVTGAFPE